MSLVVVSGVGCGVEGRRWWCCGSVGGGCEILYYYFCWWQRRWWCCGVEAMADHNYVPVNIINVYIYFFCLFIVTWVVMLLYVILGFCSGSYM